MTVPCLSLWQPWASLIAVGAKTVETRSWPVPTRLLGARLAIHAAKTKKGMNEAWTDRRLWEACEAAFPNGEMLSLPYGAIVALVTVEACVPTARLKGDLFGNYEVGRYGWMLSNIVALEKPIPTVGRQGIFTVAV